MYSSHGNTLYNHNLIEYFAFNKVLVSNNSPILLMIYTNK